MEKIIKMSIDIDDNDELLCGDCRVSKQSIQRLTTGAPLIWCNIFNKRLLEATTNTCIDITKSRITYRCDDCLLKTNTKRK